MADGFSLDTSELRALAADMTHAPARAVPATAAAVKKGAVNVKAQLIAEMRASAHFKGAANDIDFDLEEGGLSAAIGPHSGPGNPGALASIAYFGTSKGGGTVPDPQGALDAEAPRLEKALGDILEGLL